MNNNFHQFCYTDCEILEHYDCQNIVLLVTRLLAVRLENRSLIPYRAKIYLLRSVLAGCGTQPLSYSTFGTVVLHLIQINHQHDTTIF
jgi:hypothetical protein